MTKVVTAWPFMKAYYLTKVTITQNEESCSDNFCNKCAISFYIYHLPFMYHDHSLNNKGGNLYRMALQENYETMVWKLLQ